MNVPPYDSAQACATFLANLTTTNVRDCEQDANAREHLIARCDRALSRPQPSATGPFMLP